MLRRLTDSFSYIFLHVFFTKYLSYSGNLFYISDSHKANDAACLRKIYKFILCARSGKISIKIHHVYNLNLEKLIENSNFILK